MKQYLKPMIPVLIGVIFVIAGSLFYPDLTDTFVRLIAIGGAFGLAVALINVTIQTKTSGMMYKNGRLSEVFFWGAFSFVGFIITGISSKLGEAAVFLNAPLFVVGCGFVIWLRKIFAYAKYIKDLKEDG